jgi:hypothetical protein
VPVADALMAPATAAAAEHPFPVAISEGLAPVAGVPQAPTGEVHAQVSETLSYNAQAGGQPSSDAPSTAAPAPAPQVNDLAHIVGRIFHKLFRRG